MSHWTDQPLDEAQLLALIEDQLDASAAARLKAELAAKPELLAQIEAMRADRVAIRALPEPALSRDLLEALEPALARPMLLAPLTATEYRKRHARQRRPRIARFALAAALLLALFAGVWAASTGFLIGGNHDPSSDIATSRTPGEGMVAMRGLQDSAATGVDRSMLATADEAPHERITVHHLPPPVNVREALAHASRAAAPAAERAGIEPVEAPFVLVIETDDLEGALAMLSDPLGTEEAPIALVRNVTEEEVLEFGHMLALRNTADRQNEPPAVASTDPEASTARPPLANAPARASTAQLDAAIRAAKLGEQIAGEPERAAPVEDQLRLSAAGVQYALTVPADRLAEALMAINFAAGQTTSLRSLDALDAQPKTGKQLRAVPIELEWLEQLRAIRQAMADVDLSEARDVVIPVRVDVRDSRTRK